jgi:hypothetical protein
VLNVETEEVSQLHQNKTTFNIALKYKLNEELNPTMRWPIQLCMRVLQTIGGGSGQAENFRITGNSHFNIHVVMALSVLCHPPRPRPQCAGVPRRLPLITLFSHIPNFNIFYLLNNYTPQKSM